MSKKTSSTVRDILFATENNAWEAIGYLQEAIRHSGQVTFAALLDLVDKEPSYEDDRYGWLNLDNDYVDVMPVKDGYILVLPEMVDLDIHSYLESDAELTDEMLKAHGADVKKKKLVKYALIAGATATATVGLYLIGRKLSQSEVGFKLKTKLIRKLMNSQITNNNKTFLVHYALDENYIPTEIIGKLSATIDELLGDFNQITNDIYE